MTIIKHDDEYYRQRKPKPDLGPVANFKRLIWDPERKAFFDRTTEEWGSVTLFYLCFYGVLFSVFALQMWLTYKYVSCHGKPILRYNKTESKPWVHPKRRMLFRRAAIDLHGPGIVLKPNIIPSIDPNILLINMTDESSRAKYVKAITEVLSEYRVDYRKYDSTCSNNLLRDADSTTSCFFDVQSLGQCAQEPYGFTSQPQPCLYLKFNKRFGWQPVYYSQANTMPDFMPKWLQKVVQTSDQYHVWLSCEGVSDKDNELMGEIEYLPTAGFPVQFFPFTGQPDYLSPVVALRFKNLRVNQVVSIECKTWAINIDNENRYNLNFQVMIKNPQVASGEDKK